MRPNMFYDDTLAPERRASFASLGFCLTRCLRLQVIGLIPRRVKPAMPPGDAPGRRL